MRTTGTPRVATATARRTIEVGQGFPTVLTQTRRTIIRLNRTAGRCGYPEPTAFRLAR